MKTRTRFGISLSFLFSLVGVTACDRAAVERVAGDAAPSAEAIAQVTGRGEAAAKVLTDHLGAQLKSAMERGRPVAAITVCQQVAIPLLN